MGGIPRCVTNVMSLSLHRVLDFRAMYTPEEMAILRSIVLTGARGVIYHECDDYGTLQCSACVEAEQYWTCKPYPKANLHYEMLQNAMWHLVMQIPEPKSFDPNRASTQPILAALLLLYQARYEERIQLYQARKEARNEERRQRYIAKFGT
jgi:hypothetical protein